MSLTAICSVCGRPTALFETCQQCIDSAARADPDSILIMSGFANSSIPPDRPAVNEGFHIPNRLPKEGE